MYIQTILFYSLHFNEHFHLSHGTKAAKYAEIDRAIKLKAGSQKVRLVQNL